MFKQLLLFQKNMSFISYISKAKEKKIFFNNFNHTFCSEFFFLRKNFSVNRIYNFIREEPLDFPNLILSSNFRISTLLALQELSVSIYFLKYMFAENVCVHATYLLFIYYSVFQKINVANYHMSYQKLLFCSKYLINHKKNMKSINQCLTN